MNERTKTGLEIVQVAVIVGVLGDVLLRAVPWGLNVLLFNAAFAAGMIMLLRRRAPEYLTRHAMALFGALIFFASMFVWRDSIELRFADTAAIITILSVLFLPRMKIATQTAGVFHYIVAFLWSAFNAAFAPAAVLAADIDWKTLRRGGWSRHLFSVLRAVAIVTPILLIFGALFAAADAVYAGWIERVFNILPETVVTHALLISIFSWLSAGYLRGILMRPVERAESAPATSSPIPTRAETDAGLSTIDRVRAESGEYPVTLPGDRSVVEHLNISDPPDAPDTTVETPKRAEPTKWHWAKIENTILPPAFTLGTVEVGVILGLINLLFLSFVIVQVPYLFGGMELVQNTPDFKLAEYARRGFGELVAVSALVLPILLVSHWLVRKENALTEKLFRVLAGVQIALLFVIMASAVQRLVLLTGDLGYGLTTIRLYPMIFMMWLAVVFVWFGLTVLRGARKHFAWGALWSAFLILGATHVLNPDEFIVKTNIALAEQGREFDADYNSNLSDDALPVLLHSFESLSTADQQTAVRRIAKRYCQMRDERDMRSWNLSRWRAARMLTSNEEWVREMGDCDVNPVVYPHRRDF